MRRGYLFVAIICFTLALLLGVLYSRVAGARICVPRQVEAVIAWTGEVGIPVSPRVADKLYAMQGTSFWVKDRVYGHFDWPSDWRIRARFWMWPDRQQVWFVVSDSRPGRTWILWFPNDATFHYVQAGHDYYGPHPCNNFYTDEVINYGQYS